VVYDYKENTNYFKKLGANNGLYVESQAKDITNKVMILYSRDIDNFVNNILNSTILFEKIKQNYNEYIYQGSSIISNELDSDFKNKFLNIYSSDSFKIMLKDDINDKISLSKNKILKRLEENVANGQVTIGEMAVGAIAIGAIARFIAKKILIKATVRGLAKWVPFLGWGLAAYDLATVNKLYDTIGDEIKTEFHKNETLILSTISNELTDINNISSNYKQDITDITFNFIKKAKSIYLSTENNLALRKKILNSDNYTYLQFSETFYQIPIEYYDYLANKFLSLSLREMEYFHTNISQLNDIYIFDNIKYFENKYQLTIGIDNYFKLTKLFNEFNTQNEIDTYFIFTQKLFTIDNLTNKNFLLSLLSYDIIKNETSLFQNKYIAILRTSKNIEEFNKFLSVNIKKIKEFKNKDISLLNSLSLEDKQEFILSPLLNSLSLEGKLELILSPLYRIYNPIIEIFNILMILKIAIFIILLILKIAICIFKFILMILKIAIFIFKFIFKFILMIQKIAIFILMILTLQYLFLNLF
jgi:hypothetical protein